MKKRRLLFLIIFLSLACAIILGVVLNERRFDDKMKNDIEYFENIFEKKIVKIELRKSVDLPEYIQFSDADLIRELSDYLKTIKISSVSKYSVDINGGKKIIKMYFDNSRAIIIEIIENEIKINGTNYMMESSAENPINQIYQNGIERGYLKKYND